MKTLKSPTCLALLLCSSFWANITLADEIETVPEEEVPPLREPSYPHELMSLGNGTFLIVRDDGLAKTCVVDKTQFRCGGWQRLPK